MRSIRWSCIRRRTIQKLEKKLQTASTSTLNRLILLLSINGWVLLQFNCNRSIECIACNLTVALAINVLRAFYGNREPHKGEDCHHVVSIHLQLSQITSTSCCIEMRQQAKSNVKTMKKSRWNINVTKNWYWLVLSSWPAKFALHAALELELQFLISHGHFAATNFEPLSI